MYHKNKKKQSTYFEDNYFKFYKNRKIKFIKIINHLTSQIKI